VRLRDGNICANPHCGCREGLQAHHLKFRSEGGRTELWNEVLLCPRCHALIHQGLLEVRGDPAGELEWKPAAEKLGRLDLDLAEERRELAEVPVVRVPEPARGAGPRPCPTPHAGGFSTIVESAESATATATGAPAGMPGEAPHGAATARFSTIVESFPFSPGQASRRFPAAVRALEKLGYSRREARERLARAWEDLVREGSAPDSASGSASDSVPDCAGANATGEGPLPDDDLEQTILNRALRLGRGLRGTK
jgi:hypothetical protein